VIDTYVKAYQTAELDKRAARIEQLSDAELLRIAGGGLQTEVTPQFDETAALQFALSYVQNALASAGPTERCSSSRGRLL
jgi:hypothetical protein